MKPLKVGQRVSVVTLNPAERKISHGRVARLPVPGAAERIAVRPNGGNGLRFVDLDSEGTRWCRGWSGEAVNALRAADALAETKLVPADLGGAIHAFVKKVYQRFQGLPPPAKLAVVGGVAVAADVLLTALDKPTTERKT